MARSPRTAADRATDVRVAYGALADLLMAAERATERHGADDERTQRAWAAVEAHGATIHRQARLLAGKPKGG